MKNEDNKESVVHYNADDLSIPEIHRLLLGGVAPRPIALVSTVSSDNVNNLAPFSFFNVFSAKPPIVAFSPSRRGHDSSLKDTYNNLVDTGECVIHAVTHSIVQQVNLTSTQYPPDVDEFIKSGLTPISSDLVKPKRVKESPFQMECIVKQIISFGESKGAGNLIICEVIKFHIDKIILKDGIIHPDLIDLVGRNSGNFYTRASNQAIFKIEKPSRKLGMGYDNLPEHIKQSQILSANNLAQLANCDKLPSEQNVTEFINSFEKISNASDELFERYLNGRNFNKMMLVAIALAQSKNSNAQMYFELTAKEALEQNETDFAWKVLICSSSIK
ncbi:MAG: flavin reductase family protein [Candidatus Zixiibacteriota bacterium]